MERAARYPGVDSYRKKKQKESFFELSAINSSISFRKNAPHLVMILEKSIKKKGGGVKQKLVVFRTVKFNVDNLLGIEGVGNFHTPITIDCPCRGSESCFVHFFEKPVFRVAF